MKMVEFFKAVFAPAHQRRTHDPLDLLEFNAIRKKTHESARRLARAVEKDNFSAMVSRMKNNGRKRHK